MRILLSTYGSRGDVEPLVALAVALRAAGAEARLCAPADDEFVALAQRAGVELVPAFARIHDWIAEARGAGMTLPQMAAVMVPAQFAVLDDAATGCDAVVATGLFPSAAAARAVAERRGLPHVSVAFCPRTLPSPEHPPYQFPGHPHPPGATDNRALWDANIAVIDTLFGAAVNAHRTQIGLPRADNVRDHVFGARRWLAADPVLAPWTSDALHAAVQTGAWILPDTRALDPALLAFLAAGVPPVYVGFGSMMMQAAPDAARDAIAAARGMGRRVLLASGWARLAAVDGDADCFVTGDVNQQALFPRVAAVVHHGGAGTTTAAARAGVPQLIVPQVADQPYWAERVAALEIGVAHDGPVPDAQSLATGLAAVLAPGMAERAATVSGTIADDGSARAAARLIAGLA